MPNPATVREQRLRKTKAQLIDEIDTLEQRVALINLATRDNLFDLDLKTDRISFPIDGRERLGLLNWDCTGKSWAKRIHPDDQEEGRAQFNAATKGEKEQYSVENRLKDDDGNWRWLHTRGVFQRGPDGRAVRMIGSAADITERKRAEEELAKKEAQLRVALDNMPGGMMLGDRDLNYVFFNSQFSELYEFPDGLIEVGGSIRDELRYQADRGDFGPGDKDELIEQVVATYQKGEAVSYEREIAGSGRTVQIYMAPTPEGGYVEIITDMTKRKRDEEAATEAKRRSEEASELVAEKNRMLESLSNQLSKYLSPQVYASTFAGKQSVEIASKRKKLTVFFSDIADFTGTTDSLESEELTNLLNHYLTEMSKIALDHGATIDKYVGDAIIAFVGDPETRGVKQDARTCVTMAIAMQRRMRELQSEWLDMGLEKPFELRIGINTGFCTVGNFGSADRMDYTIIGNEVNLAARLEAHAEVGGILMAHETHSLVKDTVMTKEGDALTVKGFAKPVRKPVRTYSVVGLYDNLAEQGRIIRMEQDGLALVIDRDKLTKKGKAEAIKGIKDVLSQLED